MGARALVCALLVLATAFVFAGVRDHEFVAFDDYDYVVENRDVLPGAGVDAAVRAFTAPLSGPPTRDPYRANFHPATTISLQISQSLHGLDAGAYHLTNVALHALAAVALFLALSRLTGAMGPAAFVAAVFAVHPLHVESVAWVSQRKDVLSALFWMLTLYAYAVYAERPGPGRYLAVGVCVLLGLLAKSVVVTLPFVLLLLDHWPLRRLGSDRGLPNGRVLLRAAAEKLPLLAAAAVVAALTVLAQRRTGSMDLGDVLPLDVRLWNACLSYLAYLQDAVWPSGLAVFYPHPRGATSAAMGLFAGGTLLAATVIALRLARTRGYLVVGWLWFLGTLVPMIGLVQVGLQARADRYTYLPLVGLSIAVAYGAADFAAGSRRRRRWVAAAGIVAVVSLAAAARVQVSYWRDSISLFERTLAVTENNWLIRDRLADAYARAGRIDDAANQYRGAIAVEPRFVEPHLGLADMLARQGDFEGAIASFRRGLSVDADHPRAHAGLGFALLRQGRAEEGHRNLVRAISLGEASPDTHAALAAAAQRLGRSGEAAEHYREALRLDPRLSMAVNNLAWILATDADSSLRDPAEAVRLAEAELARTETPTASLLDTLAVSYAAAGRFADAEQVAAQALALAESGGASTARTETLRGRIELFRREQPYVPGESR